MRRKGTRLSNTVRATIGAALALLLAEVSFGQQATLQITSPADGTLVSPGQNVSVNVISPTGSTFATAFVVGEKPIGGSASTTVLPAQFSLSVPADISPRKYSVTAVGTTTSGQRVESSPILIDVERPDLPIALAPVLANISFQQAGDAIPLVVLATFSDGSILDVRESSYITYGSTSTSVATVGSDGTVTAVASGSGFITATYTRGGASVQASIPVTVAAAPGAGGSANNFVVSATPGGESIAPGGSASFALSVNSYSGFTGPVALSANNSPNGISATFNPASVSVPGTSIANFSVPPSAPLGPNILAVAAAGGGATEYLSLLLTVSTTPGAPAITTLTPNSGTVGTPVAIAGVNFGTTQGTSTVTFNGTAATPTSWSATSIAAPVPGGATSGNVVVTVGGLASNGVNFTVSSGGGSSLLLLGSDVLMNTDHDSDGQAEAFPVAAAASGTLNSLTIYIDTGNAATQLTAGLYSDSGGHPGSLLAQGTSSSLAPGSWTSVTIPATSVTVGSKYWIAILGTGGQVNFRDGQQSGCSSEGSSQTALTSLPGTWSTGVTYSSCTLSAYGQ